MTIIQKPNSLLITALMGWLVSFLTSGLIQTLGHTVFTVAIIIWAYLELTKGANLFRKVLGGAVLIVISFSLFNQLR
jgi:hypothetical protein